MCSFLAACATPRPADNPIYSPASGAVFSRNDILGHWKGKWYGKDRIRSGDLWITIGEGRSEITAERAGTWEVIVKIVNADPLVRSFTLSYVGDENLQYACRLDESQMLCTVYYFRQSGPPIKWSTAELIRN